MTQLNKFGVLDFDFVNSWTYVAQLNKFEVPLRFCEFIDLIGTS
jgi:hypothetical protein